MMARTAGRGKDIEKDNNAGIVFNKQINVKGRNMCYGS